MSGKYPAYAAYKAGGDGLGFDIPETWLGKALKHLAAINMGQSPSSEDCNQDGIGVPFLQGNAEFGAIHPTPKQYCDRAKKLAARDCYLFSVRAPVGALNIADQQYGIGRGLCALTAGNDIGQRYLFWALLDSRRFLNSIATGSTFEAVSAEQVGNTKVVLPPFEEQTQIAKFLDYETAKIDALIEKQQQLIALLKEKRQAVISHAVTKGLNPDVPMRDSGIEWLGEVPAHWIVTPIKQFCYVNDGNHGEEYPKDSDSASKEDGVSFIRAGDFKNFKIVDDDFRYISREKNDSMRKGNLQENDILFVNRGATIGKIGVIDSGYVGANLNSQIAYLRVDESKFSHRYLMYYLSGSFIQETVVSAVMGGALPQYPIKNIVNLIVCHPSGLEELRAIAAHLDLEAERFDSLEAKFELAVELLQERRTALISAAVTGKIDVRDWEAPEAEAQAEVA